MPRIESQLTLLRLVMGCLLAIMVLPLHAQAVTITAFYEPDPKNPANTHFVNTTPSAGYCKDFPLPCREQFKTFTVGLPITYRKETERGASDLRDRFFIQLPAQRSFTITNTTTGDSYPVEFRITHISQKGRANNGVGNKHPLRTRNVAQGCAWVIDDGVSLSSPDATYLWSIRNPTAPAGCASQSSSGETGFRNPIDILETGIAFELKLPSPIKMPNGVYTAQQTYSVGPGRDFDLGNGVSGLNTDTITFDFELAVNHGLKVDFPPDASVAVLEPPGGWGAWLHQSQPRPLRLRKDIPFRVWASGPFQMFITCRDFRPGSCRMLPDSPGSHLNVETFVTLPSQVLLSNGRPVRRERLSLGSSALTNLKVRPATAVFNEPSILHFESILPAGWLTDKPGRYEALVTVHFFADF
ncbi:hypothetical protein D9M71_219030 [compost metagenome]